MMEKVSDAKDTLSFIPCVTSPSTMIKITDHKLYQSCLLEDIESEDASDEAAIFRSAWKGSLSLLQKYTGNLRIVDSKHKTLLHFAAGYGHVHVVSWLLDQKLDVNAQSNDGATRKQ